MKYFIRALMQDERKYTFRSCSEIEARSGLIGFMIIDMKSTFSAANKTWYTVNNRINTESFKKEFREILSTINSTIPTKESLRIYYNTHHSLSFSESSHNYTGMRIITSEYCYLLRITPSSDTSNVMIFCYLQNRLKSHIRNAAHGICFVDSNNNEICTIRDGESIRLFSSNKKTAPIPCRYIDPYTCKIGSKVWNIKAFTQYVTSKGKTIDYI